MPKLGGQPSHYLIATWAEQQNEKRKSAKRWKKYFSNVNRRSGTWMDEIKSDNSFDMNSWQLHDS